MPRAPDTQRLDAFEIQFMQRLLALADDVTGRGVPPDAVVRCLLGTGLVIAVRHDSGAAVAAQLRVVLDELAEVPQQTATVQ